MYHRCELCGNVVFSLTGLDSCPLCGAPLDKLKAYDPPDLAGSRTEENLKAALAGESQANRRYLAFAQLARDAGLEDVAAAFEAAAADETLHAHSHLGYLRGAGDSRANIEAAIAGETYETEKMYPEFTRVAEEEGFPEIAQYLKWVAGDEKRHAGRYRQALEEL